MGFADKIGESLGGIFLYGFLIALLFIPSLWMLIRLLNPPRKRKDE